MSNYENFYTGTPPAPPPKAGPHEVSGMSTPIARQSPRPPPPPPQEAQGHYPQQQYQSQPDLPAYPSQQHSQLIQQPTAPQDPGPEFLPSSIQDLSKPDLQSLLQSPSLLSSLIHSPTTTTPSTSTSQAALQSALSSNIDLAQHLLDLESRLSSLRASTQAQLLSAHALERQWRAKQATMERELARFAPAGLYQALVAGCVEQGGICTALEESFLEGGGEDNGGEGGKVAGERALGEWVKRYREARRVSYLRQERKERWDEGRVGGWR